MIIILILIIAIAIINKAKKEEGKQRLEGNDQTAYMGAIGCSQHCRSQGLHASLSWQTSQQSEYRMV